MASGAAQSWYHEKESAWLYSVVAAAEPDPVKRALFRSLAAAAEDQAARWLATRPELTPTFSPAFRARVVAGLVRKVGPKRLRGVLAAAAGSSFAAFATGATIPLVPFFLGTGGMTAIVASACVTALMLFVIGVVLSLFTGHSAFRGGLRMLMIGGGAGIAAWAVGKLLGASIVG